MWTGYTPLLTETFNSYKTTLVRGNGLPRPPTSPIKTLLIYFVEMFYPGPPPPRGPPYLAPGLLGSWAPPPGLGLGELFPPHKTALLQQVLHWCIKSIYNGFAIATDCTLKVVPFGFCSVHIMPLFRISMGYLREVMTIHIGADFLGFRNI